MHRWYRHILGNTIAILYVDIELKPVHHRAKLGHGIV